MKTAEKNNIRENTVHEQIARRAYEQWEQDGRRHGNHARHWEEAERQLFGSVPTEETPAYPSTTIRNTVENAGQNTPAKKMLTWKKKSGR